MHTNYFSDCALDGESPPTKLTLNYAIRGVGMDGKAESKDLHECNNKHLCQMIKGKCHQGNLFEHHSCLLMLCKLLQDIQQPSAQLIQFT